MNLKELYDRKYQMGSQINNSVRESDIPKEWKESFNRFMNGKTCMIKKDEYNRNKSDGKKENIYYSHDFRRWYEDNQIQIERDLKINKIINSKNVPK